jgi:hypothetical protein
MKASIISALGVVALASAQSQYSTSTVSVYTTYTVTSCAATVTDCPAKKGSVTTEYVSEYTTICPVTATEKGPAPYPTTTAAASGTETIMTTEVITISSCAPTVTNCPYTTKPMTTTTVYPCPSGSSTASGSVVVPPVKSTSSPAGVISSAPVVPASSAPVTPASSPAPVISVITISTCVPSYYTSVITVTPTATVAKTTYAPAPTGSLPGSGSGSNSTIPFTGAASGLKVGGAVMAMGLVAALL